MPWLSHKNHIKEKEIVEKAKHNKKICVEAKERRYRKPKKKKRKI